MTDKHSGYIVTLENNLREDDAGESVVVALKMIKGVASVKPIVADIHAAIAEERARRELRMKILAAFD